MPSALEAAVPRVLQCAISASGSRSVALLELPEAVEKNPRAVDFANGDDELGSALRAAVTSRAETAGSLKLSTAATRHWDLPDSLRQYGPFTAVLNTSAS